MIISMEELIRLKNKPYDFLIALCMEKNLFYNDDEENHCLHWIPKGKRVDDYCGHYSYSEPFSYGTLILETLTDDLKEHYFFCCDKNNDNIMKCVYSEYYHRQMVKEIQIF